MFLNWYKTKNNKKKSRRYTYYCKVLEVKKQKTKIDHRYDRGVIMKSFHFISLYLLSLL